MKQYLLNFKNTGSFHDEDYIVTKSNIEAIEWIKQWPNWGSGIYQTITCILGEKGSGKTHLAQIWSRKSYATVLTPRDLSAKTYRELSYNSYILENLSQFLSNEVELFHLLEYVISTKKNLLITTDQQIKQLHITLPDLQSRLNSIFVVEIKKPDEAMIEQILVKYFSDRQISISSIVIKYLVARVNFSYREIAETVEKLDKASLAAQKNISIPFIKSILNL